MYDILKYGAGALRGKAEPVEAVDAEIKKILDEMAETMRTANGVGLAAPQIGIPKRMFVFFAEEDVIKKVVNPVVTVLTDEIIEFEEGCLSVPGVYKNVKRPGKIKLAYQDEKGQDREMILEGFRAVVAQHEYDHLEGILFVDKISPVAKRMIQKKLSRIKKGLEG
ncbi:MAG: peptide deformylase [Fusobacteriaceae bacterium]|nr:peptide deformylase [Fusobacteriaceae bacterium]